MTMMKTLAQAFIAVAQLRAGPSAAVLGWTGASGPMDAATADRILAGDPADAGIGALLEQLSEDTPAATAAQSNMDNLITGFGTDSDAPQKALAGFGTVLRTQFDTHQGPPLAPSADQEATAKLLLTTALQVLCNDPAFDADQRAVFLAHLRDIDAARQDFVHDTLDHPAGPAAMAGHIPPWLEPQAYMIAALVSGLLQDGDGAYLRAMAGQLAIGGHLINRVHDQLGLLRLGAAA